MRRHSSRIARRGLVPILEPEVSIKSPDKKGAEAILLAELKKGLGALPPGRQEMLKLTIPDVFAPLIPRDRAARVVALSGGYSRPEGSKLPGQDDSVIASFSRALVNDLRDRMTKAEFDAALASAIDEIYQATTVKA